MEVHLEDNKKASYINIRGLGNKNIIQALKKEKSLLHKNKNEY